MGEFSELIKNGIERLRQNDYESYMNYLSIVADVRGMKADTLKGVDAFFVPNDDYLALYCGGEIRNFDFDCYDFSGMCKWSNQLVVPIYDVADSVVGLGGFNPFAYAQSHEEGAKKANYYQYSRNSCFKKGNYVYCPKGIQCRAMEEGYICVVDGLFDAISLADAGFNACSLMGSSLTPEIMVQLKMVKNVILVCDNDDAGIALRGQLSSRLSGARIFSQSWYKDIDECLKSEHREETIQKLHRCITGYL